MFNNTSTDLATLLSYVQDLVPMTTKALKGYMDELCELAIFQFMYPPMGPYSIDGTWFFPRLLEAKEGERPWYFNAVTLSMLSALAIALVPLLLLLGLYGLMTRGRSKILTPAWVASLLAFAAGSLLADVVFHMLPEIYGPAVLDATGTGTAVLAGIFGCWLLELMSPHEHGTQEHVRTELDDLAPALAAEPEAEAMVEVEAPQYSEPELLTFSVSPRPAVSSPSNKTRRTKHRKTAVSTDEPTALSTQLLTASPKATRRSSQGRKHGKGHGHSSQAPSHAPSNPHGHSHGLRFNGGASVFSRGVWIQVLADAIHNFTDGLALSAAWLRTFYPHLGRNHGLGACHGHALGFSTSLAILLHELPHNISDLCVLMNLGQLSLRGAFGVQLLTGLCVLLGALTGLLIGAHGQALFQWILPYSAGSFLYLSLSVILPTLLQQRQQLRPAHAWRGVFSAVSAFILGILFIALLSH